MRARPSFVVLSSALLGAFMAWTTTPAHAGSLVFHAVSSGQEALDAKDGGGNPFASALIQALKMPDVKLMELPETLRTVTLALSNSKMTADVPRKPEPGNWNIVPAAAGEVRKALVLVVSDYSKWPKDKSLPGAKNDAGRMAAALRTAGFDTEVALDLDGQGMREKLVAFGEASRTADAAVIYTTGHGVEVGGRVFVIPGDYPIKQGNAALEEHAVPLAEFAAAPHAKVVNLVFYGGCRNNPFAPK